MRAFKVKSGNIEASNESPIFFIAGNCVIENEKTAYDTALRLKKIFSELKSPFVYKASFDKANRTSVNSFRGPGVKKGLEILSKIKKELKITVLADIHLPQQAQEAAEVADILQIPAFLCRQTDLIAEAAKTGKAVNIKKGQFVSPWEMANAADKVLSLGNKNIFLTERGTFFGYGNLVVDMRSLEIMKSFGFPVIFDCTHSVQKPGALGKSTGGDRQYAWTLAKAAVSCKIAGLFLETHPNPPKALSDGPNSVYLKDVKKFVFSISALDKFVKKLKDVKL